MTQRGVSGKAQPESITVVIADDHMMLRYAIKRILEREGDITVVGEASTGDEALDLAQTHHPDVLIPDHGMDGAPSTEGIKHIRTMSPPRACLSTPATRKRI